MLIKIRPASTQQQVISGKPLLHTPQNEAWKKRGGEEEIDRWLHVYIYRKIGNHPHPRPYATSKAKPTNKTQTGGEAKQTREASLPRRKGRPRPVNTRAPPKDSSLQEKRLRHRRTPPKRQIVARVTSSSFNGRGETQRTGAKKIHTRASSKQSQAVSSCDPLSWGWRDVNRMVKDAHSSLGLGLGLFLFYSLPRSPFLSV